MHRFGYIRIVSTIQMHRLHYNSGVKVHSLSLQKPVAGVWVCFERMWRVRCNASQRHSQAPCVEPDAASGGRVCKGASAFPENAVHALPPELATSAGFPRPKLPNSAQSTCACVCSGEPTSHTSSEWTLEAGAVTAATVLENRSFRYSQHRTLRLGK